MRTIAIVNQKGGCGKTATTVSLAESESRDDDGMRVWRKVLHVRPGAYEYRYVVDGEWREDPANPDRVPSLLGPPHSRLVVR